MLLILTLIFLCTYRKGLAEVGKLRYFAQKKYAMWEPMNEFILAQECYIGTRLAILVWYAGKRMKNKLMKISEACKEKLRVTIFG
jgi:hypothetical protein